MNSRLDEVQAAILRVKLSHLDLQNARRSAIAAAYDATLAGSPLQAPQSRDEVSHVYHLYVTRSGQRDRFQGMLRESGVGTGIHYPVPVHCQPAYAGRVALGPSGCPETENAAKEILSLPIYPEMTDPEVETVCAALKTLFRHD